MHRSGNTTLYVSSAGEIITTTVPALPAISSFTHCSPGIHSVAGFALDPFVLSQLGGLRYWKDGRDAPAGIVMAALFDYPATDKHPAHTMQMRVNFVDGSERR